MRANGDTISLAYLAGMATVVLKGAHSANAGEVIFETGISTRVVRGKLPKSIAVGDRITFSKLTTPTMVKAQKAEGNPAIA
ncbi:MAG: hypothetical protein KBD46_00725 [Candidatus Levybacteria bacterium]|nr:hypothetical protein [Candidatus Levybacteria bacterium]